MFCKVEGLTDASNAKLAEDVLSNELFNIIVNKMKKDAFEALNGAKWDDQGDSLRRKKLHEIEVIDNLVLQFKNIIDLYKISLEKKFKEENKNGN
jgi:hypothetical protein